MIHFAIVENREDPLLLGRCQVRVIGLHTPDKHELPTSELPWAIIMQPTTSAAMNGIGHSPVGLVQGTWVIVMFQDADKQQPIILGSVGGIPSNDPILATNDDETISFKGEDNTKATPQILTTNASGKVISNVTVPPEVEVYIRSGGVDNSSIIMLPPNNSVKNIPQAVKGIAAIVNACKSEGYTDRRAQAAILAAIGAECGWIPYKEDLKFDNLASLILAFPNISPNIGSGFINNADVLAEYVYGKDSELGSLFGNYEDGDGKKYIGRGFFPIRGKHNYSSLDGILGTRQVDGVYVGGITEEPNRLDQDLNIASTAAVKYIKLKIGNTIASNDLKFYYAVCRVIGTTSPRINNLRNMYFEYFMQKRLPINTKSASPGENQYLNTGIGSISLPGGSRLAYSNSGFTDPNGKYPLREFLGEEDTNRLARGRTDGTSVASKDNNRTIGIKTPWGGMYDQPSIPYSAEYPYNKVFESESGHVMEFDDTPERERINLYHRSGTYTEIDANGTQVNKIVGDGYYIMERNGCIYISGTANLTVDGNINILCNANANIEVMGNTKAEFRGNASVGIHKDANIAVGGNLKASIKGDSTLKLEGTLDAKVIGKCNLTFDNELNIAGKDIKIKCDNFLVNASANIEFMSKIQTSVDSIGISTIGATNGAAGLGAGPKSAKAILIISNPVFTDPALLYPIKGDVIGSIFTLLETPPRNPTKDYSLGETAEEFSDESKLKLNKSILGTKSTFSNVTTLESKTPIPVSIPKAKYTPISKDSSSMSTVLSSPKSKKIITFSTIRANPQRVELLLVKNKKPLLDSNGIQKKEIIERSEIIDNLQALVVNVIEKLYDLPYDFVITSTTRQPGDVSQASSRSKHYWGKAVDIQLLNKPYDAAAHFKFIQDIAKTVPYDQLILEYRDPKPGDGNKRKVWIHISFDKTSRNSQAFTMLNDHTNNQGFALLV